MAARCAEFRRLVDELVAAGTRAEAIAIIQPLEGMLLTLPPRDRERAVESIRDLIREKAGPRTPDPSAQIKTED